MADPEFGEELEEVLIAESEAGERLDKILAGRFKDVKSRTYFQYLFQEGKVSVNGLPVKKQYRPRTGDLVEVQFILTPELNLAAENIPLRILYEDESLIAIDKPPGMVVHPAPGNWSGTVVNALLFHCTRLKEEFQQEHIRPGIVHRLDKETSGVLLAAKSHSMHGKLVDLFSSRQVYKEYLAVCLGNPGRGIIDKPIGRDPYHRKQMKVLDEGGKRAVTEFETLATDGQVSLVKIILKTGRTHQIRVHMQSKNAPVLGDSLYGSIAVNKKWKAERQLLHAYRLSFLHPMTKKPITFQAPLPPDLSFFAEKLKLSDDPRLRAC
ncbi:RluA family pseudouridine synthase [Estrella lausannensis]|uniref:Pseudouridine synthase n=1 Tax=Estrella lausannensis TaxID=483423 RepID=A0A0H5E3K8_9BACT|nr:RluA family pseudouridine synthase [Estrella lausannensis]CRX37800.1 RNA pseudouridine synthase [Estrella lausannensis]